MDGCDAFGESYTYLLKRLRFNALRAFRGRSSLKTFISVCLGDRRWWKDFVEMETGKVKLPKALQNEPDLVQRLFIRIAWGWDDERTAKSLKCPPEEIAAAWSALEEALRRANLPWPTRTIETVPLDIAEPEDDQEKPFDAAAPTIDHEIGMEAVLFWGSTRTR
jgi:hypothetical protein